MLGVVYESLERRVGLQVGVGPVGGRGGGTCNEGQRRVSKDTTSFGVRVTNRASLKGAGTKVTREGAGLSSGSWRSPPAGRGRGKRS